MPNASSYTYPETTNPMPIGELRDFPHRSGVILHDDRDVSKRWVWFKSCRTAGTSVFRYLAQATDTICSGQAYQPKRWDETVDKWEAEGGHCPFSWTIVRHPVGRVLSCLSYFHIDPGEFAADPLAYLSPGVRMHMAPQWPYVARSEYVVRFETLGAKTADRPSWPDLCDRLQVPRFPLPVSNRSRPIRMVDTWRGEYAIACLVARDMARLQSMGIRYEWPDTLVDVAEEITKEYEEI